MAKILVIRLSAIGDVAMTVPVIHSLAMQYPQHQITVLSKPNMSALFKQLPSNVSFKGVDTKEKHRGFQGLNRLYDELKEEGYDYIADFHDVLRTKYLRLRFRLGGKRIAYIDKGRKEKKALTKHANKSFQPLKTSFQRYADVLAELGLPVQLTFRSIYEKGKGDITSLFSLTGEKGANHWIGMAPFATHPGKIYPTEKIKEIIKQLSNRSDIRLFLFGGGKQEIEILSQWEKEFPSTVCVAGKLKWDTELALISHLNVMVSMDSSNMHLASMVGTPVVSIWGATHPYAGFMGWNQSADDAVQVDLPCRPCSIYGNKPCSRGDYACLHAISTQTIVEQIEKYLS